MGKKSQPAKVGGDTCSRLGTGSQRKRGGYGDEARAQRYRGSPPRFSGGAPRGANLELTKDGESVHRVTA